MTLADGVAHIFTDFKGSMLRAGCTTLKGCTPAPECLLRPGTHCGRWPLLWKVMPTSQAKHGHACSQTQARVQPNTGRRLSVAGVERRTEPNGEPSPTHAHLLFIHFFFVLCRPTHYSYRTVIYVTFITACKVRLHTGGSSYKKF